MHSLWQDDTRRGLRARLELLTPDTRARWGGFTAPQMLAHIRDTLRMALGELHVSAYQGRWHWMLRRAPFKQLFIYARAFPRNAAAPRELILNPPEAWADDMSAIQQLMERAVARSGWTTPAWPRHSHFGRLSTRAWGVLGFRHLDHHLRQFGV